AHRLSEIGFEIQELDENTDVLAHQRRSPKISTAVCSGCNATALYAKTITKKCHITLGCTGQWLKPVAYTVKAQYPRQPLIETIFSTPGHFQDCTRFDLKSKGLS